MTRMCPRCQIEKPLSEFGTRTRRGKKSSLPYCKPCHVTYHDEWRKGKGRARFTTANVASRARYPERRKAREVVNNALKSGRLTRDHCEIGGESCGKAEAHHDDYSKPLAVRWVCRKHHRMLDRQRRGAVSHFFAGISG